MKNPHPAGAEWGMGLSELVFELAYLLEMRRDELLAVSEEIALSGTDGPAVLDAIVDVPDREVSRLELRIDRPAEDSPVLSEVDVAPRCQSQLTLEACHMTLGHGDPRWYSGKRGTATKQRAKCTAAKLHLESPINQGKERGLVEVEANSWAGGIEAGGIREGISVKIWVLGEPGNSAKCIGAHSSRGKEHKKWREVSPRKERVCARFGGRKGSDR